MKMKTLIPCLTIFLFTLWLSAVFSNELTDKVQQVKRDISFLNLLNGLYLTEDQIVKLLAKLDKVDAINKEADLRYAEVYWKVQDHYNRLKKVLIENRGIPQEMEMLSYKYDGELHEILIERDAEIAKVEDEVVADVLKPHQVKVINDFIDCVIPPDSLRNPERVGQMPDNGEYERILEKVRKMSDKEYPKASEEEIAKMIEHIDKHHCVLSAEEKALQRGNFQEAFAKIRALPYGDYKIQLEKIAEGINYDNVDNKWWVRHVDGECGEVGRYLLDSRNIPLLQQRLAMTRNDEVKFAAKRDAGK